MLTVNGDLAFLTAELRARLDGGTLDGHGPVTLTAGQFADRGLAGRILLADLDHLTALAEHTGSPPTPDRWAILADDMYLLLLRSNRHSDGTKNGQDDTLPLTP